MSPTPASGILQRVLAVRAINRVVHAIPSPMAAVSAPFAIAFGVVLVVAGIAAKVLRK